MITKVYHFFDWLFALSGTLSILTFWHYIARILLVYICGIIVVRIHRQFMGINTPFNYILNFTLGSILASAVTGEAPFLPLIGMVLFIMSLNFVVAVGAYHSHTFEIWLKGKPEVLVKEGIIQWDGMRRNHITKDELLEALHLKTNTNTLTGVKWAYFENSGQISFVLK